MWSKEAYSPNRAHAYEIPFKSCGVGGSPAASPPPYTTSYYVGTTNERTMYNLGCDLGNRDASLAGTQDDIVILMFGSSPIAKVGQNGVKEYYVSLYFYDPKTGYPTATFAQVANLAEQFGSGYYNCSGNDYDSHLRIVVGTGNYKPAGSSREVSYNSGHAWGQLVGQVSDWFANNGYSSQVDAAGGSDMELAWDTPTETRAWVDGYASATWHYLYDFGDAQGCPVSGSTASPSACSHGWTQEDVRYISWGAPPAWPLPQIYNTKGVMANHWQQITLYSALLPNSFRMFVAGSLTQYQACQQRTCAHGTPTFGGTDNTPEAGWTQLSNALNGDSQTAQTLRWSTDIKYAPK
jgi:hypothetical protein